MALSEAPTGGKVVLSAYTVDLMDEMGRGTFGTVYRGRHNKTKAIVAVKKMQIKNEKVGSDGLEEIKKFEKIEAHENIVRLHDFHYHDNSFWMIMEFCDLGDIEDYIENNSLTFEQKLGLMFQCADGLSHMHNQTPAIIHRDIKPGNILLKDDNGKHTVKLTDFGVSKLINMEEMMRTAMFSTVVGTPGFMAPELYLKLKYDFSVDVFAFGLLLKAIVSHVKKGDGLKPLSTFGAMMTVGQEMMMLNAQNQPMPEIIKDEAGDSEQMKSVKNMIRSMTIFDPSKRIKMMAVKDTLKSLVEGKKSGASPSTEILHFHPRCGHNAQVFNRGMSAKKSKTQWSHGTVMTHRPLRIDERFEVRIVDKTATKSAGSLIVGVTPLHPNEMSFPKTISDIKDKSIWVIGGSCVSYKGERLKNLSKNLDDLKEGDRIGMMRNSKGELHLFMNDIDIGAVVSNLPQNVYGVIELYGKTNEVCIIEPKTGAGMKVDERPTGYLLNRKRLPTPPSDFEQSDSEDDDDKKADTSSDDSDSDDEGIALRLMRDALQEHLLGMLGAHDRKKQEETAMKGLTEMELIRVLVELEKFDVGDKVSIERDIDRARELQEGFGGWYDHMKPYLGQEATVVAKSIINVRVQFKDGKKYSYNPHLLYKVGESSQAKCRSGSLKLRKKETEKKFKENDIVKIYANKDTFQKLMEEVGLWRDWLKRVVGLSGIVHKVDTDGDVIVELVTGEKVWLHPDTLKHVDQTGMVVEDGDLVFVINDLELVKKNQEGFGGWNDDMKQMLGHATSVSKVIGEKAILQSKGNKWAFNVKSLLVVAKYREIMDALIVKRASRGEKLQRKDIPCKVQ